MKHEIIRICPASLGKIICAIYFISGCIAAVWAFTLLPDGNYDSKEITGLLNFGPFIPGDSGIKLLFYPFISGIIGMVFGVVLAWVYNGISIFTGGIRITIDGKNRA